MATRWRSVDHKIFLDKRGGASEENLGGGETNVAAYRQRREKGAYGAPRLIPTCGGAPCGGSVRVF